MPAAADSTANSAGATTLHQYGSDVTEMARSSSDDSTPNGRKLKHWISSASSGQGTGTDSTAVSVSDNVQYLRFETMSNKHARILTGVMKGLLAVSVISIVVIESLKESSVATEGEFFTLNRSWHIAEVVIGIVLLVTVDAFVGAALWRLARARRLQLTWSMRRRRAMLDNLLRAVLMNGVLASYIAINAIYASDAAFFCHTPLSISILDFLRWLCWDTILLQMLIYAHGPCPVKVEGRADGMIRDLPLRRHWKKGILWAAFAGFLAWQFAIQRGPRHHVLEMTRPDGSPLGTCAWGERVKCSIPAQTAVAVGLTMACVFTYCVMFVWYLLRVWLHLRRQLYQRYRLMHQLFQMQVRFNAAAIIVWLVGVPVLAFGGGNVCSNWALTWTGILPLLLCFSGIVVLHLFMTQPRLPSDGFSPPSTVLQEFAWTYKSRQRKVARRARQLAALPEEQRCASGMCASAACAPMFCIETAIKTFFWSTMIYDFTEAEGHTFSNIPEEVRVLMGDVGSAMALFGLERRHLFYDRQLETKVLVAWNYHKILLCIRGSMARQNFIEDAKFLQTAHPPTRRYGNGVPRVHRGFLATWHTNGVRARVLAYVRRLLASHPRPETVKVIVTGHSLGGAVGTLAAFDMVRELDVASANVSCYTFGCPRVGNHTFAAEYATVVPDTWHVINDQDVVVHGMKLWGWYKRNGNRVILTGRGDLIVRPTHLELSLLQNPFNKSVTNHHLASYHRALFAVIEAQLDSTQRHDDGIDGLLHLLRDVPIMRVALKEHAAVTGTSLVDRLGKFAGGGGVNTASKGDADAALASGVGDVETMPESAAALANTSERGSMAMTPSARRRVLRDAGLLHGSDNEDDDSSSDRLSSPTSSTRSERHHPLSLERLPPQAEDALGNSPREAPAASAAAGDAKSAPATTAQSGARPRRSDAAAHAVSDAANGPAPRPALHGVDKEHVDHMASPLWCTARHAVRGMVRLAGIGPGTHGAPTADGAAWSPEPSLPVDASTVRRAPSEAAPPGVYGIPEEEGSVDGDSCAVDVLPPPPGRVGGRKGAGMWRCPLQCSADKLPTGANLEGCVLDMGADPVMNSCRLGATRAKRKQQCAAAAEGPPPAANTDGEPRSACPWQQKRLCRSSQSLARSSSMVIAGAEGGDQQYVDYLGGAMLKLAHEGALTGSGSFVPSWPGPSAR